MQNIYLVCTRAAISASALTYIINQSPNFYNIAHENLWGIETSDQFGTAYTINDWWNIPPTFNNIYNFEFRNTNNLTKNQLLDVVEFWDKFDTEKSICLFTHAVNIKEIVDLRNKYSLPITIITTNFGSEFYKYADLFLKREYNSSMNEFESMFMTWKYIYENILFNDLNWSEHSDIVLQMSDWLDNKELYHILGIEENKDINLWIKDYLTKNQHTEWNVDTSSSKNKIRTMCYILTAYKHMFDDQHSKILFAIAIYQVVKRTPRTKIEGIITQIEELLRISLTH